MSDDTDDAKPLPPIRAKFEPNPPFTVAPPHTDDLASAIAAAKSALKRNGFDDPLPYIAWKFAIAAALASGDEQRGGAT